MNLEDLLVEFEHFLTVPGDADVEMVKKCIQVERERASTFVELNERIQNYFAAPQDVEDLSQVIVWKHSTKEQTLAVLKEAAEQIVEMDLSTIESIEQSVKAWIEEKGYSNGEVLSPLRLALSGMQRSASPFEYLWILGRESALDRLKLATKRLENSN